MHNKKDLLTYLSMKIIENIQENFPFLSVLNHVEREYVGIIINQDAQITSIYDYGSIRTDSEKAKFIELGEIWWWESNRQIPINIFLGSEIQDFRYAIKNFNTKDIKVLFGPVTSLNDIIVKRVKRKSITLIKKIN